MDQQSRRPSRSPRNQRSRSADVDCLKKYMERRVEMRRHTEAGETSRWIPLSKNPLRSYVPTKDNTTTCTSDPPSSRSNCSAANREGKDYHGSDVERKSPRRRASENPVAYESGKAKYPSILKRNSNFRIANEEEVENEQTAIRHSAGRSLSADVTYLRRDSVSRWNERYVNFADREKIVSKWTPESGSTTSRYIPSPLSRRTSDGDRPKMDVPSNARWPTFARHPAPSFYQKKMSDRCSIDSKRPSIAEAIEEDGDQPCRNELVGWKPVRKFAPKADDGQQKTCAQGDQEQHDPDVNSVKQRLRELYDFKIETEWPKRVLKSSHESLWISKSSSEEGKCHQLPESPASPVRRNSQDLEFNDQIINPKTSKNIHQSTLPRCRLLPEIPTNRRDSVNEKIFEPSTRTTFTNMPRVNHRRTHSDDYENPSRRKCCVVLRDTKWNSDSATTISRVDMEPLHPISRNALSINYKNHCSTFLYDTKRLSVGYDNCIDKIEVLHRRSKSHYESKSRRPRPELVVEDLYEGFREPKWTDGSTDKEFSPNPRRNSTCYNTKNM